MQRGAWLLAGRDGRRAVLKCAPASATDRPAQLAHVVEQLRATGYPTPAWLAAGVTGSGIGYHVQEFAPGLPATPLTDQKAGLLVEVLERHAGLDPDPESDRSAAIASAVLDESAGGLRRGVRRLGPAGVAVLDHYDALLHDVGPVNLPGGDLVHGDFNTCNVLLDGGRVSAVIDIEELGSGTRVIDYACLLREAYVEDYGREVEVRLRDPAEAVAGPAVLAVCVAATAFFIVGFKARHQPDRVGWTIAALHRLADDLAGRSG